MRIKPPARRQSFNGSIKFGNIKYVITVGVVEDKVCEVFINSAKHSNDSDDIARDFGLVLSLALQHGCSVSSISTSLGAGTFAGAVITEVNHLMRRE